MPMVKLKGVGLINRCRCAYNQPDSAANSAANTNTLSRACVVSTPIDSAMMRPDLSARMARPGRESNKLVSAQINAITKTQINPPMARGDSIVHGPMRSAGTPLMPV